MALRIAAKKHHTEVRNWVKKIPVTRQDKNMRIPIRWVLFMLETKRGVIVANR